MRLVTVFFLMCLSVNAQAEAAEVVISDDGRQIKLNADGTWQQLSQDRFATNAAGQRIRLHPDGTWSMAGRAPASTGAADIAPATALEQEPVLYLSDVAIVRRVIQRTKSKHAESRMRFMLEVDNRTEASLPVPADLVDRLVAKSSRGTAYSILSATASVGTIPPGERVGIEVWAKDSPTWFGIKYLSLEVAPDTFGNGVTRILSRNMNEVKRQEVEQF